METITTTIYPFNLISCCS